MRNVLISWIIVVVVVIIIVNITSFFIVIVIVMEIDELDGVAWRKPDGIVTGDAESFGLSWEDAEDRDWWKLRIKGESGLTWVYLEISR